jgi:hypothetical protein
VLRMQARQLDQLTDRGAGGEAAVLVDEVRFVAVELARSGVPAGQQRLFVDAQALGEAGEVELVEVPSRELEPLVEATAPKQLRAAEDER